MNKNMRIISSNDFDTATLTSTPACVANSPITNLQIPMRSYVARMSPVSTPWVIGATWATDRVFSGLTIYKHNFDASVTVRIQLFSDTAKTQQLYDTGLLSIDSGVAWGVEAWGSFNWGAGTFDSWPASYFNCWFDGVAGVRGITITISNSANQDGYLEIGRIYLGSYWSPEYNLTYGMSMSWEEKTNQFRTDGNSLRSEGYQPYRVFKLHLDALNPTDRTSFAAFCRAVGRRKDFLISLFPEEGTDLEHDHTAAVKLVTSPPTTAAGYNRFETTMEMEEI